MDTIELRDIVEKALKQSGDITTVDPIEGETDVLGVEKTDGELFFVKVIPA